MPLMRIPPGLATNRQENKTTHPSQHYIPPKRQHNSTQLAIARHRQQRLTHLRDTKERSQVRYNHTMANIARHLMPRQTVGSTRHTHSILPRIIRHYTCLSNLATQSHRTRYQRQHNFRPPRRRAHLRRRQNKHRSTRNWDAFYSLGGRYGYVPRRRARICYHAHRSMVKRCIHEIHQKTS